MYGIRGLDAYLTAEPDDTVICAGCGYPIPDAQLVRYMDADGDVSVPEDAMCDGCQCDEQDSPYDSPTDGQWK